MVCSIMACMSGRFLVLIAVMVTARTGECWLVVLWMSRF